MIIELFFAVINELYTMSSAWQIRRTLLNAAKTFLLRPGNPQLESIRQLLQTTALDDNTSDAGLAQHIRAVRAAALPTADERGQWPASRSAAEQEKLRVKARRLLVERGMPQALTSVMGAAASGEALGRVFDCFQVERVARGLVFGLVFAGAARRDAVRCRSFSVLQLDFDTVVHVRSGCHGHLRLFGRAGGIVHEYVYELGWSGQVRIDGLLKDRTEQGSRWAPTMSLDTCLRVHSGFMVVWLPCGIMQRSHGPDGTFVTIRS